MVTSTQQRPTILDGLASLADLARCRILLLVEEGELAVGELAAILGLPQSTVSRHLKALADEGWVAARREGTRRWYGLALGEGAGERQRLWDVVRESVAESESVARDRAKLRTVLESRRERSRAYFRSAGERWDRVRDALFGPGFQLLGVPALLPPEWVVGDLGCGTGPMAEALAPHVARVIAVDESAAMIEAARRRLSDRANVEVRQGELEDLPIEDGSLDAASLVLVLPHLADPARAVAEAARVLRQGGRLLVIDLEPHDRADFAEDLGHVRLGVSQATLERHFREAGFAGGTFRRLPPRDETDQPALFVAVATRA